MNNNKTNTNKIIIALVTFLCLTGLFFIPPIAQDKHYHNFADARILLGIPNFWNVLSNFPFLIVGFIGIWKLRKQEEKDYPIFSLTVLFAGVFLTGLGSSWYHSIPSTSSLVWDRLPMTIVFMALVSVMVSLHVNKCLGNKLLLPLLVLGIVSVLYWYATELNGNGDLRPYVFVQFYPIVLILLLLLLYPRKESFKMIVLPMLGMYILAKFFEFTDQDIYAFGKIISGHTIKHLCAAASVLPLLRIEQLRIRNNS